MAIAWHASIDPVTPPSRASFDKTLVQRGTQLASIGNCAGCHTAQGGTPFAGGTPLRTPFGTIYGPNITPDAKDGIGGWSPAAFHRALREGVSREGYLLYPAFPYDHFTHLQDADIDALYAFVMTREPVPGKAPANEMRFPMNFRSLVAGWNLLYLDKGPKTASATPAAQGVQTAQTAEWQRGAYLTDALAHCAACHSPRNALGAEKAGQPFAGGSIDGWHATALNTASPSPVAWNVDNMTAYLRTGLVADHALTAGPMEDVVHALSRVPEADRRAIATYVVSLMGQSTPEHQAREAGARQKAAAPALRAVQPARPSGQAEDATLKLGAQVYADSCAQCHDLGRGLSSASGLHLPLAVALYMPVPDNLIRIVREGIYPPQGQGGGRIMPAFNGMSDEQLTALISWLRYQGSDAPPWPDGAKAVKDTKEATP